MAQLIIGHVTANSAKIWIRGLDGQNSATVTLADEAGGILPDGIVELQLPPETYNTTVKTFQSLQSNTKYFCLVVFNNGKVVKGSLVTMPVQVDEFSFLLGSCHFSLGPDHKSPEFKRIQKIATMNNSRFMISCGDQMYIDTLIHPLWVNSEADYAERYIETWHSEELSTFFANMPQYMIIDDHEIYNDFVNGNLNQRQQEWFCWAIKTYGIFQHSHNPDNGNKFYYEFECAHAAFFVMDLRTERTGSQMISDDQMQCLANWFSDKKTKDKIKFIVSSVPFITQLTEHEQKDKWSGDNYFRQRDQIIQLLMESEDKKVIFLSGDIHLASHASISYQSNGKTYQIHEFISSPIKQIGANILNHETPETIRVNNMPLQYSLGNHMGRPVKNGETRHHLKNNVMSITAKKDSVFYSVYALNENATIFEQEIFFD